MQKITMKKGGARLLGSNGEFSLSARVWPLPFTFLVAEDATEERYSKSISLKVNSISKDKIFDHFILMNFLVFQLTELEFTF